jgi:crotonobetainyl-CoA:carnitine CoA-transferase CaiB-like acyl-CoA transferase
MGVLSGLRILDFSQVLAGPFATELMGGLGADVVKVEGWKRLEIGRGKRFSAPPERQEVPTPQTFCVNNTHKRSVALDLSKPEGREIALVVGAKSDVVVEAFRPGVMKRLGLGYEEFCERNESIIMISISGNGNTGPEATHASYAGIFCALGGLTHLTGYRDGMPTEYRGSGDLRVGWNVALAILAALIERRRTGRGRWIDLSGREVMSGFIGDAFLAAQASSETPEPEGNEDRVATPAGCFLSAQPDTWVALAIQNDAQWIALCNVTNHPDWKDDERFGDAYLRWVHRDALNSLAAEWIRGTDGEQLVNKLQGAGIGASLSMSADRVLSDSHLQSRSFVGKAGSGATQVTVPRPPWIATGSDWRGPTKAASSYAQDTEVVLETIAGLSSDEIEKLAHNNVLR